MAKAVFQLSRKSPYADRPGYVYQFPKRKLLERVKQCVDDWVVLYEGRRGGGRGYYSAIKVTRVEADPSNPDYCLAHFDPSSEIDFERNVNRLDANGNAWEEVLRKSQFGGENTASVRLLSEVEFAGIVDSGLPSDLAEMDYDQDLRTLDGFEEMQAVFDRPVTERLIRRPYREAAFARTVKRAYGYRCAISGLSLRNGGGRPEVEAAHIRAVQYGGPDTVRNGMALSHTLHWMFDRGLISVADDFSIMISHNKVPKNVVDRLIVRDKKVILPDNQVERPHPEYLRYHRENVFGQVL